MAGSVEDGRKIRREANPHYPAGMVNSANQQTVSAVKRFRCTRIAEFGILDGETSLALARYLDGRGALHLFDFQHNVDLVVGRLAAAGFHGNIHAHGNSTKLLDNYNWSLAKMLADDSRPIFDYAFIDGAHTWNVDTLTFFLVDQMLDAGGYIDFDDYDWNFATSPTMAPHLFPTTVEFYTDEQITDHQVKRIIDTLIKNNPRYVSVIENKVYQKRY